MKYNIRLKADDEVLEKRIKIGHIPALIVRPRRPVSQAPGILWIHGGGYITGLKEMVYMSRAIDLVKKFGAVVISPDYRLAVRAPYPAALKDCFRALLYMKTHADVWHSDMHAFDMLRPDLPESRKAIWKFEDAFAYAAAHYFAVND